MNLDKKEEERNLKEEDFFEELRKIKIEIKNKKKKVKNILVYEKFFN